MVRSWVCRCGERRVESFCRTCGRAQCWECGTVGESRGLCEQCRALLPGTILSRGYRALGPVASGGLGTVFRAEMLRLGGRPCALKEMHRAVNRAVLQQPRGSTAELLSPEDRSVFEQAYDQYQRDVETLAHRVRHPGIPLLFDRFEANGRLYLAMELVEGETLLRLREREGLSEQRVVDWGVQAADILRALHEAGGAGPIVHGDITPTNLMVARAAGSARRGDEQVYLVDFGVARLLGLRPGQGSASAITRRFAAPEQWDGEIPSIRTDLYGLAATLSFLLIGETEPEAVGRSRGISAPVRDVLVRTLAEDPARRPASAAELGRQLDGALTAGRVVDRPSADPSAPEVASARPLIGPIGGETISPGSATDSDLFAATNALTGEPVSAQVLLMTRGSGAARALARWAREVLGARCWGFGVGGKGFFCPSAPPPAPNLLTALIRLILRLLKEAPPTISSARLAGDRWTSWLNAAAGRWPELGPGFRELIRKLVAVAGASISAGAPRNQLAQALVQAGAPPPLSWVTGPSSGTAGEGGGVRSEGGGGPESDSPIRPVALDDGQVGPPLVAPGPPADGTHEPEIGKGTSAPREWIEGDTGAAIRCEQAILDEALAAGPRVGVRRSSGEAPKESPISDGRFAIGPASGTAGGGRTGSGLTHEGSGWTPRAPDPPFLMGPGTGKGDRWPGTESGAAGMSEGPTGLGAWPDALPSWLAPRVGARTPCQPVVSCGILGAAMTLIAIVAVTIALVVALPVARGSVAQAPGPHALSGTSPPGPPFLSGSFLMGAGTDRGSRHPPPRVGEVGRGERSAPSPPGDRELAPMPPGPPFLSGSGTERGDDAGKGMAAAPSRVGPQQERGAAGFGLLAEWLTAIRLPEIARWASGESPHLPQGVPTAPLRLSRVPQGPPLVAAGEGRGLRAEGEAASGAWEAQEVSRIVGLGLRGRLAYSVQRPEGRSEIVLLDLETGRRASIWQQMGPAAAVAWSPGGHRLAIVSAHEGAAGLYILDLARPHQAHQDAGPPRRLRGDPRLESRPAWTPDGAALTFGVERAGEGGIALVGLDDSPAYLLTRNAEPDRWPSWSPDGQRLLFVSTRDGRGETFVMAPDGTGLASVLGDAAEDAAWSPTGQWIAFVARPASGAARVLEIIAPDGSGRRTLTDGPSDASSPAWSPDGRHLAFVSRRPGSADPIARPDHPALDVISLAGSTTGEAPRPVWVEPDDIVSLSWAPTIVDAAK